jgi:hypothetical protein
MAIKRRGGTEPMGCMDLRDLICVYVTVKPRPIVLRAAERPLAFARKAREPGFHIKEPQMIRKTWIASIFVAALMLTPTMTTVAAPTDVPSGDITITATVVSFAEWDTANDYNIVAGDFDGTIGSMFITRTATRNLKLFTNVDVSVKASSVLYAGILTDKNSGHTHTLTTAYNLTGGAWLDAGTPTTLDTPANFFAHTYALSTASGAGAYTMVLTVTAAAPAAGAPVADDYEAKIKLTATWGS